MSCAPPPDVAVSFSHHFALSLDAAVAALCAKDYRLPTLGRNVFSQLGSWSQHVASWVDASGLNAHGVRYEDMLAKPRPTFGAVARYLGRELARHELKRAIQFSAFDRMREQERRHGFVERGPTTVQFFRQGRAGGRKKVLSPAQVARLVAVNEAMMIRFGYLS